MPILISHNSALESLRSIPPQMGLMKPTSESILLKDTVPLKGEVEKTEFSKLGISQRPIHHLMPASARRSDAKDVKSHVTSMSSIPSGLVSTIGSGLYACGPELTFVQLAKGMSLVGAVVLGHELCGTYSHFARFVSGFYERQPLTTVARLEQAIQQLEQQGMKGLGAARRALRWVRDGSASPMETVVSCMLHLPKSMGGFGLMAPQLNYEETLDDDARRILGKRTCRVDAAYVYEAGGEIRKKGIEFDGRAYHRDAEADRARREVLAHMGWVIYVLDVDDLTEYQPIKDKVTLLGDVPVQRERGKMDEQEGRRLLDRLFRATRFGVGMNPVLFGVTVPKGKVKVHL